MKVSDDLEEFFGDYLAEENEGAWETAKARLRLGDAVSGVVVAQYRFGVFVDIGAAFPALLEVIQFERASGPYTTMEKYPKVGSTVEANLVWFDDRDRQIKLTQRSYDLSPDSQT
jgi:ribosomal protein S1